MKCKEVNDKLKPYLDQEVTVAEQNLVEAHLSKCAACRDEAELSKWISTVISEVRVGLEIEPDQTLADRIAAAIKPVARETASFIFLIPPEAGQFTARVANRGGRFRPVKIKRPAILTRLAHAVEIGGIKSSPIDLPPLNLSAVVTDRLVYRPGEKKFLTAAMLDRPGGTVGLPGLEDNIRKVWFLETGEEIPFENATPSLSLPPTLPNEIVSTLAIDLEG